MAKVCKSGGEGIFAERHGNAEVAPIPDLPCLGRFDPFETLGPADEIAAPATP
jgi:hypothetical protein